MNRLKYPASLAAFILVLGCGPKTENTSSSGDGTSPPEAFQSPALTLAQATNMSSSEPMSDTNRSDQKHDASSDAREPDNTGKNERDRNEGTLTPFDQGKTQADVDLTRKIRRSITSNDQLSTTAKNIKIITVDGKVTLRGPVNSQEEQKTIASIVQGLGVKSVDDQLEVKEQK